MEFAIGHEAFDFASMIELVDQCYEPAALPVTTFEIPYDDAMQAEHEAAATTFCPPSTSTAFGELRERGNHDVDDIWGLLSTRKPCDALLSDSGWSGSSFSVG